MRLNAIRLEIPYIPRSVHSYDITPFYKPYFHPLEDLRRLSRRFVRRSLSEDGRLRPPARREKGHFWMETI